MPRTFITGGRQRGARLKARDEWQAYEKAVLLELDTESGAVRTVLEHASPPGRCPAEDPSFVFKAASWDGDTLLLCTQTEVLFFDPRAERVVRTLSHPWMNDVHHVTRIDGRLHVVSTGLDAVLVFDEADEQLVAVLSATAADPSARFSRATDYRLVPTTKPHQAHPNYLFTLAGRRWVTRFEQRDALCLDAPAGEPRPTTPRLADDPIHDGVLDEDGLWFTVVSGAVLRLDRGGARIEERYNLDRIGEEGGRPLGWCRGILREGGLTYLCFSRLRPTALKQNLAWLRRPLGKAPEPLPARVVAYDLARGRKLQTWALEEHGISSIFSILPAAPPAAAPAAPPAAPPASARGGRA
jgi:hypothetical protein